MATLTLLIFVTLALASTGSDQLFRLATGPKGGEAYKSSSGKMGAGTVVVNGSSLLCPPREGNYSTALFNRICQVSGFETVKKVLPRFQTAHSHRAGYGWARKQKFVAFRGASCTETSDCDLTEEDILPMYDHPCSIDEVLTLYCSGERFTVKEMAILANPTGDRGDGSLDFRKFSASSGSLVLYIHDVRTDKTVTSLVKFPSWTSTYFSYAITSICKHQGYLGGLGRAHSDVTYENRLSVGFLEQNNIGTMVHTISCTSRSIRDPVNECSFEVIDEEPFDPEESVVAACGVRSEPAN